MDFDKLISELMFKKARPQKKEAPVTGAISFINTHYTFPYKLKQNNKYVAYWEYTGDPNAIDTLTTSCGCSGAKIDKENNRIIATYSTGSAAGDRTKHVYVWLKDGQPRMIKDAHNGMQIPNHKKKKIDLSFSGFIA